MGFVRRGWMDGKTNDFIKLGKLKGVVGVVINIYIISYTLVFAEI